jgi:hypothetical protein
VNGGYGARSIVPVASAQLETKFSKGQMACHAAILVAPMRHRVQLFLFVSCHREDPPSLFLTDGAGFRWMYVIYLN